MADPTSDAPSQGDTTPAPASSPVRFGVFELDLRARQLRTRGVRVRLGDQPFHVLAMLLETHVFEGNLTVAIATLEDAVHKSGNLRFKAYLGYAYALAGRVTQAREVLQELIALRESRYVSSYGIALIHDALGEESAAVSALERASVDRAVEFIQPQVYLPFRTPLAERRHQELTDGTAS